MQKIVWSETGVEGEKTFEGTLPQPEAVNNFYRDIAVLALPAAGTVRKNQIVDMTSQMTSEGRLTWKIPPGKWVILRFGHTSTGKKVHPTPAGGEGLECDKMNPAAVDLHFNSYAGRILENSRGLAGDSIKYVEIDSYEAGDQNWTPGFRDIFQQRNGYDMIPCCRCWPNEPLPLKHFPTGLNGISMKPSRARLNKITLGSLPGTFTVIRG